MVKGVTEGMYLMYVYVYNEMFFPNRLSYEKANDKLAWHISFSITYPKALNLGTRFL